MSDLEAEAKQHIQKLEQSLDYHKNKFKTETREGVKYIIDKEVKALEFVLQYAREALAARGIWV